MRLEHHLVGGYVRYISPHIIIIIITFHISPIKTNWQVQIDMFVFPRVQEPISKNC